MADGHSYIFTSESVTEGHPDKVADQISDAVLDAVLKDDPAGRVACEVLVTTGLCLVAGEVTTGPNCHLDIQKLARDTIRDIGYNDARYGFDADTCGLINALQEQSSVSRWAWTPAGPATKALCSAIAATRPPN